MAEHDDAIEAACIRAFMATPTAWAVPGDDWATVGDPTKENYRIIVRAAIAAFLRAVEPGEPSGERKVVQVVCRALAEEIDKEKDPPPG